jgi:hypothetical protein
MSHAHHFLSRLDRLNDTHQKDAKLLYYHSDLLEMVLERAGLPADCDRVAISLADPVEGPWVITTRTGKFVTCLAKGMKPNSSTARVMPQLLKGVMGAVAHVGEYIDAFAHYESRSGMPKEQALLGWVLKRPEYVSREDARALAGLGLLAPDILFNATQMLEQKAAASAQELLLTRRARHHDRPLSVLHYTLLSLAHIFAAVYATDDMGPQPAEHRLPEAFVLPQALRFVAQSPPVAVRGLWALRASLKVDGECARHLKNIDSDRLASQLFTVGVASLLAAKNLSQHEQLERLDCLVHALPQDLRSGDVAETAMQTIVEPAESVRLVVDLGRALYATVTAPLPAHHPLRRAGGDGIPEQTALATFYTIPHSRVSESTSLLPMLVAAMPHFLRAPVESLYLPARTLEALQRR